MGQIEHIPSPGYKAYLASKHPYRPPNNIYTMWDHDSGNKRYAQWTGAPHK